jgi:hypothetical protein
MPYLQVVVGSEPGRRYPLDTDRLVIGRHPDCDVVIDSQAVSRQHAQIVFGDGDYFVEDLASRNGTFVNGQLVEGRRLLRDGDRLRICDLSLQFGDENARRRRPEGMDISDPITPALLVDDDPGVRSSTITSRLDVSSSQSGVRLEVRPEVKLKALLEIMQNLARSLAVDEVLPRLLDSLFKVFIQADRGFVVLRGPDGMPQVKAEKHRRLGGDQRSRISRTIINNVMESKRAILSTDAATDDRFDMSQSIVEFRIRSMMCAPIIGTDGESIGVIQIDTLDPRSRFEEDDLDLLANVALQAAVVIENATLHEEKLRQKQVRPTVPGYHFFDFYRSAREVGGDYYNYVSLPGGKLAVVVADVSGKGIAAALLMAKLSSEVGFCLATEPTPAAAMCRLNAALSGGGWGDRFVTLVMTVLDPQEHVLTVVNAGHMPPLLRRADREVREIGADVDGMPLGVRDDYCYEQHLVQLRPGDFVTLYTDGISEACNHREEQYGPQRIRRQIIAPIDGVSELGRHILEDVRTFVGDHPQSDDICLVCFGRDLAESPVPPPPPPPAPPNPLGRRSRHPRS